MRQVGRWIGKAMVAGTVAFFLLNALCFFYSNIPVHSDNSNGATDYIWEKEKFYCSGTEGFAWGKTDKNGYNNRAVPEKMDILIMGSSHMEAFNVPQDKNAAALLQEMLSEDGMDEQVYNIGISGHYFLKCVSNLRNALEVYQPDKYAIIEMSSLSFSKEDLRLVAEERLSIIPSFNAGVIGVLQKIPYLRHIYHQIENGIRQQNAEGSEMDGDEVGTVGGENDVGRARLLGEVLRKSASVAADSGCELIVFFQPNLKMGRDGACDPTEISLRQFFSRLCEENGILFLDMTDRFLESYRDDAVLPHGFSNTRIESGHLNHAGHRMIAEELFQVIKNREEGNAE